MTLVRSVRVGLHGIWFHDANFSHHFIHIPKNGGKSVRRALLWYRQVSFSNPMHFRYVDIADQVGLHLRFFSVIRNPWSRTVSRYLFAKQSAKHWPLDDARRRYMESADFQAFVEERRIFKIPEHPHAPWMGPLSSWFNQLEWIRDAKGSVAADCLRLEHLERDLSAYLNCKNRWKRRNVTVAGTDYRSFYTRHLIQAVADCFSEDIDYFGFDFEGGATRNIVTLNT